jgi:hypothetical protein
MTWMHEGHLSLVDKAVCFVPWEQHYQRYLKDGNETHGLE